jgi:hypothetical protein
MDRGADAEAFNFRDVNRVLRFCRWSYTVVETFSLLAVGTSLIGTLLGASQFFIEQLTNLASSPSAQEHDIMKVTKQFLGTICEVF